MRKRLLVPLVLLIALVAGTVGFAVADGVADEVARPQWGACERWGIFNDGTKVVKVPEFCRGSLCEVFFDWRGGYVGAYSPGLTWSIPYTQRPNGDWSAGPAVSIGGVWVTQGFGRNGDGVEDIVHGGGIVDHGSGNSSEFYLADDKVGGDSVRNAWTVYLDNWPLDPGVTELWLYACPYGMP